MSASIVPTTDITSDVIDAGPSRQPQRLEVRVERPERGAIAFDEHAALGTRDNASMPSAPLPAKRSATSAPSSSPALPSELKIASRTRSVVGRVVVPSGADESPAAELSCHYPHPARIRALSFERSRQRWGAIAGRLQA